MNPGIRLLAVPKSPQGVETVMQNAWRSVLLADMVIPNNLTISK